MVLWSALIVDRHDGIAVSGYHRCPGPDSGFVAAYEPSAMRLKNGRKWAEAILRAEDIEAIAFKSRWILDVSFGTHFLAQLGVDRRCDRFDSDALSELPSHNHCEGPRTDVYRHDHSSDQENH